MATKTAELRVGDQTIELPVIVGSEGEHAIDISKLRGDDWGSSPSTPASPTAGSCQSDITFIDGEKGILRYRGYPDRGAGRELRAPSWRTAYLLIYGELPNKGPVRESAENCI